MNKKFGFIDYSGKEVIALTYDGVYNYGFENGKAKVSLGYKDFYINKEGKSVQ